MALNAMLKSLCLDSHLTPLLLNSVDIFSLLRMTQHIPPLVWLSSHFEHVYLIFLFSPQKNYNYKFISCSSHFPMLLGRTIFNKSTTRSTVYLITRPIFMLFLLISSSNFPVVHYKDQFLICVLNSPPST